MRRVGINGPDYRSRWRVVIVLEIEGSVLTGKIMINFGTDSYSSDPPVQGPYGCPAVLGLSCVESQPFS